jgi:hypothetical protein
MGKIRSLHISAFADQKTARVPVLKQNLEEWDQEDILQASLLAEQLGLTSAKFVPIDSEFSVELKGPVVTGVPIRDTGDHVVFQLQDGSTRAIKKTDVRRLSRPKTASAAHSP